MNSTNKILINTKYNTIIVSVNTELNGKCTNRGYLTFFIQADDTTIVAELENPCSTFFPIFLFATRTISGNYFTTLSTGTKILHK